MNATGMHLQNTLRLHPPLEDEYDDIGRSLTMSDASQSEGIAIARLPCWSTD